MFIKILLSTVLSIWGCSVVYGDYIPADSDYTYYIVGPESSESLVIEGLIGRICLTPAAGGSDQITVYAGSKDSGFDEHNYWNIICSVNAASIPAASTSDVVMFVYKAGSGHINKSDSTISVLEPQNNRVDYYKAPLDPEFDATNYGCDTPQTELIQSSGTIYSLYDNCDFEALSQPGADMGISNVEPSLFYDVNTISPFDPIIDSDNELSIQGFVMSLFGISVTTQLRNALQAMQFDTGNICHPATTANAIQDTDNNGVFGNAGDVVYTDELVGNILLPVKITSGPQIETEFHIGSARISSSTVFFSPSLGIASVLDSEACMPSLSKPEIVGLFTGGVTNWNQIIDEAGNTLIDAATAANTAAGTTVVGIPTSHPVLALDNQRVHVCRRNAGSAVNAQFQAIFLNRPCANIGGIPQSESALASSVSTCSFTGSAVVCMNRDSTDSERCLSALESGAISGNNPELFNDGDANPTNNSRFAWGVGYQSLRDNQSLWRGWRFVKIHNVSPTIENVWRGDYFAAAESTCQWNSSENSVSFYNETQTGVDPLETGATGRIVPASFKSDFGKALCWPHPSEVAVLNRSVIHAFGTGAWLTIPDDDSSFGISRDEYNYYAPRYWQYEAPTSSADLLNLYNSPRPISTWTRGSKTCQPGRVVDRILN